MSEDGNNVNALMLGHNGTRPAMTKLDAISNALVGIDYAHHELHSGDEFTICHSASGKNDGQTINIYLKTPNTTKLIHMLINWSANGQAYLNVREAPTVTANTGTPAQIYNRYRDSLTTSVVLDNETVPVANKVNLDATVTAPGTIIMQEFAGAAKQFGALVRGNDEFILKANTAYVFEVESDAAGLVLSLCLSWYEHTNLL